MRKKILFKVRGKIIEEKSAPLDMVSLGFILDFIMLKENCKREDIKTQLVNVELDLSEYDISVDGIMNYTDMFFDSARGITLPFAVGSDEYLDNIKNLESFLTFY